MGVITGFGPSSTIRRQQLEKARDDWRQALAVLLCIILCFMLLISVCCLGIYLLRDKPVYDELVDYLDKTIAISKINYNHQLGFFELSAKELEALSDHRTYKTILWSFLFADIACYPLLIITILLYLTVDTRTGKLYFTFWILFGLALLYCIVEIHIFPFLIFPYSSSLSSETEKLLNHGIPYNPGGVAQMEHHLDCSFNLNLYAAHRRKEDIENTCDPQIASSFLSKGILWTIMALRLVPIIIVVILMTRQSGISSLFVSLIKNLKKRVKQKENLARHDEITRKNPPKNSKTYESAPPIQNFPKRSSIITSLPPMPSTGAIDHNISYNNAAYIATGGTVGMNSSRNSDISRFDAMDLFKPVVHTSSSVMSEV